MDNGESFKNTMVQFINYLSEQKLSQDIKIQDLCNEYNESGFHETAIISAIIFLSFLGPISVDWRKNTVIINGRSGMYALRSIRECVRANIQIVKDWERDGVAEDHIDGSGFGSGVDFMYLIESVRQQYSSAKPVKEGYISKAVIKGKSAEGEDLYLVQRSPKSGRYQLIGGRSRRDESDSPEETMKRELREELRGNKFVFGRNTVIEPGLFLPMKFVSPSFGAYTLWNCQYYQIKFSGLDLRLPPDTCWITIDEFRRGVLENGEPVLRIPDEYRDKFFKMLNESPYSFDKFLHYTPKKKIDISDLPMSWIEKACYKCRMLRGDEFTSYDIIKAICERFHKVSVALGNRHNGRESLITVLSNFIKVS